MKRQVGEKEAKTNKNITEGRMKRWQSYVETEDKKLLRGRLREGNHNRSRRYSKRINEVKRKAEKGRCVKRVERWIVDEAVRQCEWKGEERRIRSLKGGRKGRGELKRQGKTTKERTWKGVNKTTGYRHFCTSTLQPACMHAVLQKRRMQQR